MDQELRRMEDAAMRSYAKDVSSRADFTARSISVVMAAGTSSTTVAVVSPRPQVDPMMPPADFDPEHEDQRRVQPNAATSVKSETVPEDSMWVEAKNDDGYPYYWNVKTNETIWEAPKEGYMPLDEYNRINQIAIQQQQLQLQEESKTFRDNADEIAARYRREQLKIYRRSDTEEKKKKEEVRAGFKTEEEAQAPIIGGWQVVEPKKEEPQVDLELPRENNFCLPPVVSDLPPELPIKKFKEKTIESLEPDIARNIPIVFKKRKVAKGNTRQRLDVD